MAYLNLTSTTLVPSETVSADAFMVAGDASVVQGATSALSLQAGNLSLAGTLEGSAVHVCASSLTLRGSGKIETSGEGGASGAGPGAGAGVATSRGGGGGASHGGSGGTGAKNPTTARRPHGDVAAPRSAGSGGGAGKLTYGGTAYSTKGGRGGGVIELNVSGTLSLGSSSAIRANGLSGQHGERHGVGQVGKANGAGGGSGGSVLITAARVEGEGSIEATGGAGGNDGTSQNSWQLSGGGGSGGRVAVHCSELERTVKLTATGGAPGVTRTSEKSARGAPGTVFTRVSAVRRLRVDNRPSERQASDGSIELLPADSSLSVEHLELWSCNCHFSSSLTDLELKLLLQRCELDLFERADGIPTAGRQRHAVSGPC